MILFTRLFNELDETDHTVEQLAALERYFKAAPPSEASWALHLLIGAKTPRTLKNSQLREWISHVADLPPWLVDESCETVGDVAEALALILPDPPFGQSDRPLTLHRLMTERLLPLAGLDDEAQRDLVVATWRELDAPQRFVWNKLVTGSFRIGVSRTQVARALGITAGVSAAVMAHRLLGFQEPTEAAFRALLIAESSLEDFQPYPFQIANEIKSPTSPSESAAVELDLFAHPNATPTTGPTITRPEELGSASDWQADWHLDGLRVQVIRRGHAVLIWSLNDELVTAEFPEIAETAQMLPDGTVLDGDLVVWPEGESCPRPHADIEQRLSHAAPSAALRRKFPVVFIARDILESDGTDQRERPLHVRRSQLTDVLAAAAREAIATGPAPSSTERSQMDLFATASSPSVSPLPRESFKLRASSPIPFTSWEQLASLRSQARGHGAGGLILTQMKTCYGASDETTACWIWPIEPLLINAVLIAALPGQHNSSRPFSDYTFAVWNGDELVPIAKANTGLTEVGFRALDDFIRAHITGKFGPVCSVKPELVFELEFDSVQASTRHKSGLLVRSARIRRRRPDLSAEEADTLDALRLLVGPRLS